MLPSHARTASVGQLPGSPSSRTAFSATMIYQGAAGSNQHERLAAPRRPAAGVTGALRPLGGANDPLRGKHSLHAKRRSCAGIVLNPAAGDAACTGPETTTKSPDSTIDVTAFGLRQLSLKGTPPQSPEHGREQLPPPLQQQQGDAAPPGKRVRMRNASGGVFGLVGGSPPHLCDRNIFHPSVPSLSMHGRGTSTGGGGGVFGGALSARGPPSRPFLLQAVQGGGGSSNTSSGAAAFVVPAAVSFALPPAGAAWQRADTSVPAAPSPDDAATASRAATAGGTPPLKRRSPVCDLGRPTNPVARFLSSKSQPNDLNW